MTPPHEDDFLRKVEIARLGDPVLTHLAVVGDTYTVLLSGEQTAGCFAMLDMLIPPGGGPPPHRHDFEECFRVLEGSVEVRVRDRVPTRTSPAPLLSDVEREVRLRRAVALAPEYGMEVLLPP